MGVEKLFFLKIPLLTTFLFKFTVSTVGELMYIRDTDEKNMFDSNFVFIERV